jgi:hypothetical protein
MTPQKQIASTLLAAWLAEQHPDLFQEIAVRALNPTGARANVTLAPPAIGLSGFTDTLSSIWGGITNAAGKIASGLSTTVQGVGNFLSSPAGASALSAIAAAKYGQGSATQSVIATQLSRTSAGQTPAPIETVYDTTSGTYIPVINQSGQQYPVSPQLLAQLQPPFFERYGLWIAGGALGLVLLVSILRR